MASSDIIINSGNTLSIFGPPQPGQDQRFPITSSESVFTFGDFRIDRGNIYDNAQISTSAVSFSNFSTLGSFSATTTQDAVTFGTSGNELNPDVTNPNAYSYFGSFYTKISRSINTLIETFPYAILDNTNGISNTIFNYTNDVHSQTSNFRVPTSGLTNQGNIIYVSGVTDNSVSTLYKDYSLYGIQFSGTANTHTYNILDYKFTTGTTGYLEFTVQGLMFSGVTPTSTLPIYIRPTTNRYSQYQRNISNLEYQLAFDGTFKVPDNDNDSVFVYEKFIWPRIIDGFNIDTYGSDFEAYKDSILKSATRTDETKTSWMVRTMIPEQFIELDTDTQIYQKLTSVYAEEFDNIKAYIDNLAFMHTVEYDRLEGIPDKFMFKLSRLLSFDYHDAFSDVDLFEYFLIEDADEKTLQDYNLELWRKMLKNIVWLYKKKGTRDALMFIFKIMGAPDCLVNLSEFVYTLNKTQVHDEGPVDLNNASPIPSSTSYKVDTDGYVNYNNSNFVFQEGGTDRGNGQNYINQWTPEFHPLKTVDNVKIRTGDTEFGTRDIMNTKEAQVALDPASAIECDVFEWYQLGFNVWNWGSTGMTISPFAPLGFSGMTVPFEWTPDPKDIFKIIPLNISAMTVSQWLDYIYMSNVNPRNRKTISSYSNHMGEYISLKKIYMCYMLWTNNQESNRLTFGHMERLLELLERNFFKYMNDFIPATTILEGSGVVYRNTIFQRQKFVYPAGINDGSEFKKALPPEIDDVVFPYMVVATLNDDFQPVLAGYSITNKVADNLIAINAAQTVIGTVATALNPINYNYSINTNFYPEVNKDFTETQEYSKTIINYTTGSSLVYFNGIGSLNNEQMILQNNYFSIDNLL